MATIPEQYESQRVGVQGYRVLNLDLDGVCADYKGAIRDYLQRQGIDVPERALQTAHYNLIREDGWPFDTLDDYIETHKAAEREHLYATRCSRFRESRRRCNDWRASTCTFASSRTGCSCPASIRWLFPTPRNGWTATIFHT